MRVEEVVASMTDDSELLVSRFELPLCVTLIFLMVEFTTPIGVLLSRLVYNG